MTQYKKVKLMAWLVGGAGLLILVTGLAEPDLNWTQRFTMAVVGVNDLGLAAFVLYFFNRFPR